MGLLNKIVEQFLYSFALTPTKKVNAWSSFVDKDTFII